MKYRSMAHITLNQYPKNEGCSTNSIQHHCTTKYIGPGRLAQSGASLTANQGVAVSSPCPSTYFCGDLISWNNNGHSPLSTVSGKNKCTKYWTVTVKCLERLRLTWNSVFRITDHYYMTDILLLQRKNPKQTNKQNTGHWPKHIFVGQS